MRRFFLIASLIGVLFAHAAERSNLKGNVLDEKGAPIPGATVAMYTAKPKLGPGLVCPSCYADCSKRVRTDGKGEFIVPSLRGDLIFKVLVAAEHHAPMFVKDVDPIQGPLSVKLAAIPAGRLRPGYFLRCRLVDGNKSPIAGAVVEVEMTNPSAEHDEMAASNERGEFVLTADAPGVRFMATIEARGFARQRLTTDAASDTVQIIPMSTGGTVKGTVMKDGQAVPGVEIGLAHTERGAGAFLGELRTTSDAGGRFVFYNVPPAATWYVYGKIESLQDVGAIPFRAVTGPADNATLDLGNLEVVPGHRVEGRIQLSDGSAVPQYTTVFFGREKPWDFMTVPVDAQGRFHAEHLPQEVFQLCTEVPGYRYSALNVSLNPPDQSSLIGTVDQDVSGLVLLLEPGKQEYGIPTAEAFERQKKVRQERLRGAPQVEK